MSTLKNMAKNIKHYIKCIGWVYQNDEEIMQAMTDFFSSLLFDEQIIHFKENNEHTREISSKIMLKMNHALTRTSSNKEFYDIVFLFEGNVDPSPNRFPFFFKCIGRWWPKTLQLQLKIFLDPNTY